MTRPKPTAQGVLDVVLAVVLTAHAVVYAVVADWLSLAWVIFGVAMFIQTVIQRQQIAHLEGRAEAWRQLAVHRRWL